MINSKSINNNIKYNICKKHPRLIFKRLTNKPVREFHDLPNFC